MTRATKVDRGACTSCGQNKPCDLHHPARAAAAPNVVIPECKADHRVLTRRAERAGMMRRSEPRSEMERLRWIFRGAIDVVDRFRTREDPEGEVRAHRFGELLTTFSDMILGAIEVEGGPEEGYGPDPILNTPRLFRGKRPTRSPEWRSVNPPPESSDLPRIKTLFAMVYKIEVAVLGADVMGLGSLDVETLVERVEELEARCGLDVLAPVTDDLIEFLVRAVGMRSILDLPRLARSFHAFGRTMERGINLFFDLARASDVGQAELAVAAFLADVETDRLLLRQTLGDGAEPAPGGRQGLHHEEPS